MTPAPLKINAELALYRARTAAYEARRCVPFASAQNTVVVAALTRFPLFRRSVVGPQRRALAQTARVAFEQALALDPSDGRAYLGVARSLEADGDLAGARAVYDAGTRATQGENAFLWQAWAVLEERQGQLPRARALFDAATAADKRHAAAWHGWGMLEKRAGNFQRARDLFVRGLRLVPDSMPKEFLYQSLGVMAAERGRTDEAREHFAAGAKTPAGRKSAALWQAWALAEQASGATDAARSLLQRALGCSPKNRFTWLAWATLEAQAGFTSRARALFRQGAALNPRDAAILQAWARLEAASGRLGAARALFERAVRAQPEHQPVWQAWGCAEEVAGHPEAARLLFQRGVLAAPQSRDAAKCYQAWGVLEDRAGNATLARRLFKAALQKDPASTASWQAWAQMEERMGAISRAAELRGLCAQQSAAESVGMADTSPGNGVESLFRPLLTRLTELLDGPAGTAAAAPAGDPAAAAEAAEAPLGLKEGVLGLPGILRPHDAAAGAAAAAELDAFVAAAAAQGESGVLERVRGVVASLSFGPGARRGGMAEPEEAAVAAARDAAGAFTLPALRAVAGGAVADTVEVVSAPELKKPKKEPKVAVRINREAQALAVEAPLPDAPAPPRRKASAPRAKRPAA